jgi:hypothetical protein
MLPNIVPLSVARSARTYHEFPDQGKSSFDSCNDPNVTFTIQTVTRDQVDRTVRKLAPRCAAGMWIPYPR